MTDDTKRCVHGWAIGHGCQACREHMRGLTDDTKQDEQCGKPMQRKPYGYSRLRTSYEMSGVPVVRDQTALDETVRALTARAQEWIDDDAAYAARCLAYAASFAVCDHPHRYRMFGERVATCAVCGHQEDATDDHEIRTDQGTEPSE